MSNPQQVYLIPFVTLLIMLGPFSVDTYLPAFPAMESVYSISTADMSQTLGAFLFAFALPTLAWGPLIDRFGRKSTVVISLLMPGIGILVLDCYPKNRGVASALQGFAYMGSNALGGQCVDSRGVRPIVVVYLCPGGVAEKQGG